MERLRSIWPLQYWRMISAIQVFPLLGLPELLRLPAKREQARKKYPHAAFLMATGVDDVRVGVQAMKKGADDYLVKPFNLEAVEVSVQRALEKKRMELDLENYRQNLEQMVDQRTKQLQTAMKRIELTYDETLESLGAALDLRDNETAGHSLRVTRYCLEMATAVGRSSEQLKH